RSRYLLPRRTSRLHREISVCDTDAEPSFLHAFVIVHIKDELVRSAAPRIAIRSGVSTNKIKKPFETSEGDRLCGASSNISGGDNAKAVVCGAGSSQPAHDRAGAGARPGSKTQHHSHLVRRFRLRRFRTVRRR